jgi:hypothetical protein
LQIKWTDPLPPAMAFTEDTVAQLDEAANRYLVCLVSLVCLVHLVCFVDLVDLVHLVSFVQPKNQTNQMNKTN